MPKKKQKLELQAEQLKSGMVVLVGRSNVGKSTLMNALVGTKLAITSVKAQTTRQVIHGVVNDPRGQIVFADTPGVFSRTPDRLTARLNEKAREAVSGVDLILYVVDGTRHVGDEEKTVKRMVELVDLPKLLVVNKIDRALPFKDEYLAWSSDFDAVVEVAALTGKGIKPLVDAIFELLPVGEPLYPPDRITNLDNRTWLAELIREKVFNSMGDEIPYSVAVEVEEIEERENGTVYVQAAILTSATRYKGMLVGAGGRRIKEIGGTVRKELEQVTGRKHFLDLEVKVDERWQERFE